MKQSKNDVNAFSSIISDWPANVALSRRHLLILLSLFFFSWTDGLAKWQEQQLRAYPLTLEKYSLDETQRIAKLTNIHLFKQQLAPILKERVVDTPGHREVEKHLEKELRQYNFHVEWDEFIAGTPYVVNGQTYYQNRTFRNLIATHSPTAPRRLVVACHYDSKQILGEVFIGATDSAVPCAMLLDLARTLGGLMSGRANQEIGLQLLFLDGEEAFVSWTDTDSTYGARHLAAKWERMWYPTTDGSKFELSRELDRIDVFMLLDLLGASETRIPIYQRHVTEANKKLFEQLVQIERSLTDSDTIYKFVGKIFWPVPLERQVEDDHVPFLARNVPILHLIPVPFPKVWHTKYDNQDALDFYSIYNLLGIIRVFVARYLGIRQPVDG